MGAWRHFIGTSKRYPIGTRLSQFIFLREPGTQGNVPRLTIIIIIIIGVNVSEKWYNHEPESVVENDTCKVLWDFTIQTDHVIEARRPDLILIKKEENNCIIVDFAIPYDTRIEQKEKEKVEKYQDLKRELQKLWNMKVKVVPIVIGALGTPPKDIKRRVEELGIETRIEEMQKTVILQSARILRKVLEN